jgi:hypothetical protein
MSSLSSIVYILVFSICVIGYLFILHFIYRLRKVSIWLDELINQADVKSLEDIHNNKEWRWRYTEIDNLFDNFNSLVLSFKKLDIKNFCKDTSFLE